MLGPIGQCPVAARLRVIVMSITCGCYFRYLPPSNSVSLEHRAFAAGRARKQADPGLPRLAVRALPGCDRPRGLPTSSFLRNWQSAMTGDDRCVHAQASAQTAVCAFGFVSMAGHDLAPQGRHWFVAPLGCLLSGHHPPERDDPPLSVVRRRNGMVSFPSSAMVPTNLASLPFEAHGRFWDGNLGTLQSTGGL